MKILKIFFVSVLFTLAFSSYTELDNNSKDLDVIYKENVTPFIGEYSQSDGCKE